MKQYAETLRVKTRGAGFVDVTALLTRFVATSKIAEGLLTVFIRHTSASLLIQENADPDVLEDLQNFFARIAPKNGSYAHDTEGPDDMPAHIKSALTQTSLAIPVARGAPVLGTWQAVYVVEYRDAGHERELALHILGE